MNASWSNLIPQDKKYTLQLAGKAASLLESSDWTQQFEAAQARTEQEEIDRQRDVLGF